LPITSKGKHAAGVCANPVNCKAHVAYNFNRLFETEGLLKVTGSQVHCTCGNISEMVQDRDAITTDH